MPDEDFSHDAPDVQEGRDPAPMFLLQTLSFALPLLLFGVIGIALALGWRPL